MRSLNLEKLEILYKNDYGIKSYSKKYLKSQSGYNRRMPVNYLLKEDLQHIDDFCQENLDKNSSKKRKTIDFENIAFQKKSRSYRGTRHEKSLPVRGQRTKTNAKTNKKKLK